MDRYLLIIAVVLLCVCGGTWMYCNRGPVQVSHSEMIESIKAMQEKYNIPIEMIPEMIRK